jgi:uncharacterized membrane protein
MDSASPHPFRISPLRWLQYLFLVGMFVLGIVVYPHLPEIIPTHWNFVGQADNWSPKTYGAWLIPGLALALSVLFPLFRRIDPKSQNYAAFEHAWDVFQLALVGFMGYIYIVQLNTALHPEQSALVGRYVMFGIGALLILMGNYMGKIRQNFFVGLRTPWSLSDPEVWQRSQRFGGWAFVLGGLGIIAETFFWWQVVWVFFGIFILVVLVPVIYSYLIYRKEKTLTVLVAAVVLIIVAVIIGIRLVGSEDTWLCVNGEWVPHGVPSAPQPTEPCL